MPSQRLRVPTSDLQEGDVLFPTNHRVLSTRGGGVKVQDPQNGEESTLTPDEGAVFTVDRAYPAGETPLAVGGEMAGGTEDPAEGGQPRGRRRAS